MDSAGDRGAVDSACVNGRADSPAGMMPVASEGASGAASAGIGGAAVSAGGGGIVASTGGSGGASSAPVPAVSLIDGSSAVNKLLIEMRTINKSADRNIRILVLLIWKLILSARRLYCQG